MNEGTARASLRVGDSSDETQATYRRVAFRIIPVCLVAYIISFIDRSNIGMARLQFMHDLNFSEAIYGLGAGLFFIGYTIFEVPVNLLIERIGARMTLAVIMVLWGGISSSLALITTPAEFYVVRFLLGLAEAGLFPGIVLYLSYWFPEARRGRMMALFAMGGPLAGVIGAPIGGWLMSTFSGSYGLHGWQNLFIFEGIPAVLLGIFVLFYLDDRPGHVKWLTERQNELIVGAVQADTSGGEPHARYGDIFRDRRVYVCFLSWIGVIAGVTVVTLWTPTLLSQGNKDSIGTIGLLSAIPPLAAAMTMFLIARHSDRTGERRWHFTISILASSISLLALVAGSGSSPQWIAVVLLSVASSGLWAATPVFWTVPVTFLRGPAAAAVIALISSVGGLGGFLAPLIIGRVATSTGHYSGGIAIVAIFLATVSLLFVAGIPAAGAKGRFEEKKPKSPEGRQSDVDHAAKLP